ncbi:Zinc finger protein GLI2 [Porphyridium purpureum]|uniref:Zinc finger protein GLI2 n=1 Tax=Porphyridium purpureum TaxID=35688 RepID=A0A5J4Z6Z8_PORPP|nr:Zinc finger protein GLI2 [Porphyridium purpureum]|eukprot:POR2137..scf295_1
MEDGNFIAMFEPTFFEELPPLDILFVEDGVEHSLASTESQGFMEEYTDEHVSLGDGSDATSAFYDLGRSHIQLSEATTLSEISSGSWTVDNGKGPVAPLKATKGKIAKKPAAPRAPKKGVTPKAAAASVADAGANKSAPSSPISVASNHGKNLNSMDEDDDEEEIEVGEGAVRHSIHQCTIDGCGKFFSRRHNLKVHMRRHTGETPYSCPHEGCDKQFKWKSSMKYHDRLHKKQAGLLAIPTTGEAV